MLNPYALALVGGFVITVGIFSLIYIRKEGKRVAERNERKREQVAKRRSKIETTPNLPVS